MKKRWFCLQLLLMDICFYCYFLSTSDTYISSWTWLWPRVSNERLKKKSPKETKSHLAFCHVSVFSLRRYYNIINSKELLCVETIAMKLYCLSWNEIEPHGKCFLTFLQVFDLINGFPPPNFKCFMFCYIIWCKIFYMNLFRNSFPKIPEVTMHFL